MTRPHQSSVRDVIFDVTAQDFEARVMQKSMEIPVLVDFWAPWCGPCKQLTPILEKVVQAAGGRILLAKVNLDENQELASALRVQSVPAVFAFFQGRPLDAFQSALPESQIQVFIDKVMEVARQMQPDALDIPEALKQAAEALAQGDLQTAGGIYSQILSEDQKNVQAYIGLVRVYIAAQQYEQATQLVEHAPEEIQKQPTFQEAKTALELATQTPSGDLESLQSALDKDESDNQARYDLACALFTARQREAAIDHLLEILSHKRDWNEGAARTQLLKFFEAMGHGDPLTISSRRKLSSLLFS